MALRNKRSDSDQIAALIATLQQRVGRPLRASGLSAETGVPKQSVRKLLRNDRRVRISEKPLYEFSWVEPPRFSRKSTFPLHLFSWDVLSRRVAKKQLDRSAFLHHGTGVPAAITWFFEVSESGPRFPDVSLVFNGRTFDARIPVDNKGRYRLFWKNDFTRALGQAFPDHLSAYQQKLSPNRDAWMQFAKVSAARYEVTFSTEQGDDSVWSTRELRASIDAYLDMLRCHRDGTRFTKKAYYRDLSKRFGRKGLRLGPTGTRSHTP